RFDSRYVYMYKGFTAVAYRGQRLHAIGMTRALAEYQSRGFRGLVSYVESNNFDSLRSCYRMGYRNCGQIRVLRAAGKYFVRPDTHCRQYGLAIEPYSEARL
ncbi:MAG TPA: GNAT family acetyltransferase, partial [Terriglobia bacterium]|nr:GNAT family acetyltransferase [Terriglobia bacterium]